jgi:transposase-like protein
LHSPDIPWFSPSGYHYTKAFGRVPRFRCSACGRSFSSQSFSLDYYAKRVVDYRDLLNRHCGSMSLRGIGRAIGVSPTTVQNRLDRLARQALALHASLRPLARAPDDICIDGFVSLDVSHFFPSDIAISLTASSRFVLDLSHATCPRSGSMTPTQKLRAAQLYRHVHFERGAIERGFSDLLNSLQAERPPTHIQPLVIITDEKKEYRRALLRSSLWATQDAEHRVAHRTVHSKLPRTCNNPLFASNYLDREIRKDLANHHRESSCFNRNVANGMSRLALYLVNHNYRKRFRIRAPVSDRRVHGEVAGIERTRIDAGLDDMFRIRAFLSRMQLPTTLERIWRKALPTPLRASPDYLPRFALQ